MRVTVCEYCKLSYDEDMVNHQCDRIPRNVRKSIRYGTPRGIILVIIIIFLLGTVLW